MFMSFGALWASYDHGRSEVFLEVRNFFPSVHEFILHLFTAFKYSRSQTMERYVILVFALIFIYVTFSYAEETIKMAISHDGPESQPNYVTCPDGTFSTFYEKCYPIDIGNRLSCCCEWRNFGTCCPDFEGCCPPRWVCYPYQHCFPQANSSVKQSVPLIKSSTKT